MKRVTIKESNGQKREIGFVVGTVFISQRLESKHLYKGGNKTLAQARKDGTTSWGIDALALEGMLEHGVTLFRIESDKNTYEIELSEMKHNKESFILHHKPHRAQYFLPVHCFRIESKSKIDG